MRIPQRYPMVPKIHTYLMKLHSVSFKMAYSFTSKGPEKIQDSNFYFYRRSKSRRNSPLFLFWRSAQLRCQNKQKIVCEKNRKITFLKSNLTRLKCSKTYLKAFQDILEICETKFVEQDTWNRCQRSKNNKFVCKELEFGFAETKFLWRNIFLDQNMVLARRKKKNNFLTKKSIKDHPIAWKLVAEVHQFCGRKERLGA